LNLYLAAIRFTKKVPFLRRLVVGAVRVVRPPIERSNGPREDGLILCELRPEEVVARLQRDGVCSGFRLAEGAIEEISEFAKEAVCFADRDESKPFYISNYTEACAQYGKAILVGQYFNTMTDCVAIERIAESEVLRYIADQYIGVQSTLLGVNLWWTFVSEPSREDLNRHAHQFHYDIDDIKFVKFFFYLTDVSDEDGPHVMVVGSHHDDAFERPLFRSPRLSDEWVTEHFRERIMTIVGSKGSGVAEDTYVLHKGTVPRSSSRLMLQVEYGVFGNATQSDVR
jgi:hypothetical protein